MIHWTKASAALAALGLIVPLTGCTRVTRVAQPFGPVGATVEATCPDPAKLTQWQAKNAAGAPKPGLTPTRIIACGRSADYATQTTHAAFTAALQLPSVRDDPPIDQQWPIRACPAVAYEVDSVTFILDYGPDGAIHLKTPDDECGAREIVRLAFDAAVWAPLKE